MSFIGNFLWLIFGGWLLGLLWLFFGCLMFITVIGIPFGIACFRLASFAFIPFGKELIPANYIGEQTTAASLLGNIIWCVCCGFWLALGHTLIGLTCCTSIVGIPFGLAHFKIAKAAFAPLGKRMVPVEIAKAAIEAEAKRKFAMMSDKGTTSGNPEYQQVQEKQ